LSFGLQNAAASDLAPVTVPYFGVLNTLVFLWNRREMKTRYGKLVRRVVDFFVRRPKDHDMDSAQAVALGRDLFMTTEELRTDETDQHRSAEKPVSS